MGKCGLGAGGRTGNMGVPALSDSPSVSLSPPASLSPPLSLCLALCLALCSASLTHTSLSVCCSLSTHSRYVDREQA